MLFEVEQKHRLIDPDRFAALLAERGATLRPPEEHCDVYFAHPVRDFAQTDEALRIRRIGTAAYITYKGPKLDAATKTRRELELPLAGEAADERYAELLGALGFRPVAEVRKTRRPFTLTSGGHEVHGAMDDAGPLGHFVELELTADESGLDEARRVIAGLAEEMQLGACERRSYLELLLESKEATAE